MNLRNFRLDKNEQEQVKYEATLDAADYKLKYNAIAIRNYSIWHILRGHDTGTGDRTACAARKRGTEEDERSGYRELASNKETHSEKAGELIVEFVERRDYLEL